MKTLLSTITLLFITTISFAQVGIGTTSPKATLDIVASNTLTPAANDGILIPRVDAFPLTDPGADQHGMLLYLTKTDAPSGATLGFYYWNYDTVTPANSTWIPFGGYHKIDDLLDGKSDVDGSEDGSSIYLGIDAGANDDASDNKNIGIGFKSLTVVDASAANGTGENNTAVGYGTLALNTTGKNNTAIGQIALTSNSSGKNNTALGKQALAMNTTGDSNVAIGAFALARATTAGNNVGIGNQSMRFNLSGYNNTAIGDYALRGSLALNSGIDGTSFNNVAVGNNAMEAQESGNGNVAIGDGTLKNNVSGVGNIAIGVNAGGAELGSNKLYIENSSADANNALIYGEFDTNLLRINGNEEVNGNVTATGNVTTTGNVTATGGLKVGANGTVLATIIRKTTGSWDSGNIVAGASKVKTWTVTNAPIGATVFVSPTNALENGLIIAYARVSVANTVEIKLVNTTGANINPAATTYTITVMK